jgi:hypothetical protein
MERPSQGFRTPRPHSTHQPNLEQTAMGSGGSEPLGSVFPLENPIPTNQIWSKAQLGPVRNPQDRSFIGKPNPKGSGHTNLRDKALLTTDRPTARIPNSAAPFHTPTKFGARLKWVRRFATPGIGLSIGKLRSNPTSDPKFRSSENRI